MVFTVPSELYLPAAAVVLVFGGVMLSPLPDSRSICHGVMLTITTCILHVQVNWRSFALCTLE